MKHAHYMIMVAIILLINWAQSKNNGDDTVYIGGIVQTEQQREYKNIIVEQRHGDGHTLFVYEIPSQKELYKNTKNVECKHEKSTFEGIEYEIQDPTKNVEIAIPLQSIDTLKVVNNPDDAKTNTRYKVKTSNHGIPTYYVEIQITERTGEQKTYLLPEKTKFKCFTDVTSKLPTASAYVAGIRNITITTVSTAPRHSDENRPIPGMTCTIVETTKQNDQKKEMAQEASVPAVSK